MWYQDVRSVQQKNNSYYKREHSKVIILDKPKNRYVLDLTEFPLNFDTKSEYKYILNIIYQFSRMAGSYLLKSKNSYNILNYIKDFLEQYGIPKSVGSDNGREFKNKLIYDRKWH